MQQRATRLHRHEGSSSLLVIYPPVQLRFPISGEHTIGSAHAPVALRADWQDQLRRAHYELGVRYVRFHVLLSDRMGTLLSQ